MTERDFVRELEFLGFVTRLKRISDAMLHDGRRLYRELGIDIEPNWFVIFKLLQKEGEMPVTEIANRIGFAHPSVISIVNKMIRAGYLESEKCSADSRRRLLRLSAKAEKKLPEYEKIWQAGTAVIKKVLEDIDALEMLERLERRIGRKNFKRRTLAEMKKQGRVRIRGFDARFAKDFARLNYDWIEKHYEVEEHDHEQLDEPVRHIIKPGGEIFFARIEEKTVGTVALIRVDEEIFELAKMAVAPDYRGFNIGGRLMEACIEHARRKGKKRIVLESNTKQIPAIRLYRKYGFREIPLQHDTPYQRANIRMELLL